MSSAPALVPAEFIRDGGSLGCPRVRRRFVPVGCEEIQQRPMDEHVDKINFCRHGSFSGCVMLTRRHSTPDVSKYIGVVDRIARAGSQALKPSRRHSLAARQSPQLFERFFGGLTVEETACVLDMSPQTVMRDWKVARAWQTRELSASESTKTGG